MKRAYHVCIMWQRQPGSETYVNGSVITEQNPFDGDFVEKIKKSVCEKWGAPSMGTTIISLTRID